jgi:DNA-binding response OmpR family regulator
MDYVKFSETSGLPTVELDASEESIALLRRVRPIRIGAYTMDVTTNVIRWRGETLRLSQDNRQTLHVLLQHAGQILSSERLAALLQIASDTVDAQIHSLRTALEAAGVTWLPRRAEGCGYILWR